MLMSQANPAFHSAQWAVPTEKDLQSRILLNVLHISCISVSIPLPLSFWSLDTMEELGPF